MSRFKKLAIGAAVLIPTVVVSGIVWAAWSGSGTGPGRARATTAVQVTISPVDGAPDLYPGFTGGDVFFTLTNTNPYSITFTSMTPGAVTVDAGHPGCAPTDITIAPASGLTLVSPPGPSGTLSIPDVVSMILAAPDACQGASFDVVLTLSGSQT